MQVTGVALGVLIAVVVARFVASMPTAIRGAVIVASAVSARELPLAGVEIAETDYPASPTVRSDESGAFTIPIPLHHRVRRGLPVSLTFRHAGYEPLELHGVDLDKLCIARLKPLAAESQAQPAVTIGHVVARYSISTTTMINIGSAIKTFPVVNTGNVPCQAGRACSPDGRWSATAGSATLDAGRGNEFRNARASCIAGPCPFTRIQEAVNTPKQTLKVTALDWSDTATFLLEAEVYRSMVTDVMRESYPVIFGEALTFTLPAAAEGVSIQAELDKTAIVFPLGPALYLSWAECQLLVNKDQTKVYRCELKPGYKFS